MKQKTNHSGQNQKKKPAKSLMSRNVTQFRHLLAKNYINEDDINWTVSLRNNQISKNIQHKQPSPPQVFYKKTALSTIRDELFAKEGNFIVNAGQYEHMFMKKSQKSPTKQTLNQIKFYTDLRKDQKYDKMNSSKSHKQFANIPFRDRQEFPTFIKKEFINKAKSIDKLEKQSALDGAYNQQPYSTKLRTSNYGFFQPLVRATGRKRVNLPSLGWQIGLRNY